MFTTRSFKEILKKIALLIFGDYGIYIIYRLRWPADDINISTNSGELKNLTQREIMNSSHVLIREQAQYCGEQAYAYGVKVDGEIVSICFFWTGQRYREQRNFWPIKDNEAKLVQITTLPEMRGKGLATNLIRFACQQIRRQGCHILYARIWHSNHFSRKAFEHCGWQKIAWVIEIFPFKLKKSYKFIFKYLR